MGFIPKYEVKSLVLHSGTLRMISKDKTWCFSLRSEKPMKVRKYEMLCFFFCKGACPGHVYRNYTWIVSKLEGEQTLPCRSIFAGNRNLVRCWTVAPQAFPKFILFFSSFGLEQLQELPEKSVDFSRHLYLYKKTTPRGYHTKNFSWSVNMISICLAVCPTSSKKSHFFLRKHIRKS